MKKIVLGLMIIAGSCFAEKFHWGETGTVPTPVYVSSTFSVEVDDTLIVGPGTEIIVQTGGSFSIDGYVEFNGTVDNRVLIRNEDLSKYVVFSCYKTAYGNFSFVDFKNTSLTTRSTGEKNLVINNCVVDNPGADFLSIYGSSIEVINNTIYSPSFYSWCIAIFKDEISPIIKNNILISSSDGVGALEGNSYSFSGFNYNYVNSYSNISNIYESTENFTLGDINFVDSESGDFHLLPTSDAIDMGNPTDDYSNEPNGGGGIINVGAYGNTSEATEKTATAIISNSNSIRSTQIAVINSELRFTNSAPYTVNIFSANGQLLKEISGMETSVSLNSLGLANGIYQMRVVQGADVFNGQFILK